MDSAIVDESEEVVKSAEDPLSVEISKENEQTSETVGSGSREIRYDWCDKTNQWVQNPDGKYFYEDGMFAYANEQGITYVLDQKSNTWSPKVDNNFLAFYKMSFGCNADQPSAIPTEKASNVPKTDDQPNVNNVNTERKRQEPSWFDIDDEHNTKVYVSNLPEDITEQEFVDLMQKCGVIMKDPQTNKLKIKLYYDQEKNCLKGDALCTYFKIESVELALKILDGYMFRDREIKVERAKFQMKGDYNPKLKPRKKTKKDIEKLKKSEQKLFDWKPEKLRGERAKHERTVILKNVFDPKIFDENVSLILEYQEDIGEECKKCGELRKVIIYDRHPDGVVQVNMKNAEDADKCVQLLNNRWFGKRQITAQTWDGKTKFQVTETDSELKKRLENWDQFLNKDEKKTD